MFFFQWCTFRHEDKICDYEWKRAAWNLTVADCDAYADRASYQVTFLLQKEHGGIFQGSEWGGGLTVLSKENRTYIRGEFTRKKV